MSRVLVDLSAPQNSALGIAVGKAYYQMPALIDLAPGRTGYPHNGGEHSLRIEGPRDEVVAWLEMFYEQFPNVVLHLLKHDVANTEYSRMSCKHYLHFEV